MDEYKLFVMYAIEHLPYHQFHCKRYGLVYILKCILDYISLFALNIYTSILMAIVICSIVPDYYENTAL